MMKHLKINFKQAALTFILVLMAFRFAVPCTSVIISGEYTKDGRPIMWKHRDTRTFDNKLAYIGSGKYSAVALINSEDEDAEKIWIGFNSAGFAIMNTLSYNVDGEEDENGEFMKKALMECATVDEFEKFIQNSSKPRKVASNFGVIDAEGGAAYFETGEESYTRFDADDKSLAPHGYIVRTNYSFDGEADEGAGYIRFETAEKLFYRASAEGKLSTPFILEEAMNSLENPMSGINARKNMPPENEERYLYFQDCINRFTSTSSVVVQGVKQDESPLLTTMWSKVGFPLTSTAIPVWLTEDGELPEVVTAPGKENAEICEYALTLKDEAIPSKRGSTKYYINASKVFNADNTGITQKLMPLNKQIYDKTTEKMEQWRSGKEREDREKEIKDLYNWYDKKVRETYADRFDSIRHIQKER